MNYHERLKKLNIYSLERRRDRYLIIYGWQQIEGIKENILKLEVSERSSRSIKSGQLPYYETDGKKRICQKKQEILPIVTVTTLVVNVILGLDSLSKKQAKNER